MATVNWTLYNSGPHIDLNVVKAYTEYAPKKVLSEVGQDPARDYGDSSLQANYKKCFAFLDYLRNAYQLCAPFDIKISIDENGRVVGVETPQQITSRAIVFRSEPSAETNIVLSLAVNYVFYSKSEVLIEQLPAFMDYTLSTQGVTAIPGTFDISKWVRPIEFALEIKKGVRSVVIKHGTPLCYIRFVTSDGSSVSLQEVDDNDALKAIVNMCGGLKAVRSQTPLKECYSLAKKFVDRFLRPSRCPFRRNKSV